MRAKLEIVQVIDFTQKSETRKHHQQRGEEWVSKLRDRGIEVSCNVMSGRAEDAIAARAAESNSPLILFGLHRSGNRMVDCPDGVVSATIRQAHCPVMAIPEHFSGR